MQPFLLQSDFLTIPSFAFMIMMASLLATWATYATAPKKGLSQLYVLDIAIVCTIGGVIGMRLFHVFVEAPDYYWEHPLRVFEVWRGGFVSYGAFLGVFASGIAYCRWRKIDTLKYVDHMVLYAGPILIFTTRIGCLLAGCCFGKPTHHLEAEWLTYLVFNNPSSDAGSRHLGVPLWPTQIYAMTYAVILFGINYWTYKHQKFKGQIILTFLIAYAIFRSLLEFIRGDADRGVYFNNTISTAQIMSLLFASTCLVLYFIFRKKYPLEKKAD
ncbi:MAG: prolipoprotein diacylglyceryl transferase [Deltaproteobacteria bacterium]|nr:prolipoprotein diacylglyceryl transferase [Deltaproteobacteria bacterium]